VVLCWHLLSKDEDYAFQRPSLTRQKTRRLELLAGAPPLPRRHTGTTITPTRGQREAELALGQQAEQAYRRLIADWRSTAPRSGTAATTGHASQRPTESQAKSPQHTETADID
jgi:transposase